MKKNEIIKNIKNEYLEFIDLDDIYKKDKEIIIEAIKKNYHNFLHISPKLKNSLILELRKINSNILKYGSKELRNNKKIILESIKNIICL